MSLRNKIKEQLNSPENARSKSKDKAQLKTLDLREKEDRRSRTKPRNNLVKGAETEVKGTSRFGSTKIEKIHEEYRDNSNLRRNNGSEADGKRSKNDDTLSLSLIGNTNDQNYVIYDSAYGYNYGYKANKYSQGTQKRINQYKSDHSEVESSQVDSRSQNSKMSYKIEYLISKAFTPLVPSNNHLNDISKVSWNNRELFENIS